MSLNGFKWSNSSLSLLSSCAEAFRRRYIEGERYPSSPRQLRGRVVHHVAQTSYTRVLHEQGLPSAEEAQDLAATEFETAWSGGVELEPEERAAGEAATKGESKDFATDLSGYHVTRVAPGVHPLAVEEAVTVQLPESDVLVHGIIDLIDTTSTGDLIRDLKTGEKSPNANAAENSQQLTIYSALYRQEMGQLPRAVVLDYITRSPAKRLKAYVPLIATRDDEDIKVLSARIQAAVSLVEAGVFVPAPADSWLCNPKYCSYYDRGCPYVRRGERPRR